MNVRGAHLMRRAPAYERIGSNGDVIRAWKTGHARRNRVVTRVHHAGIEIAVPGGLPENIVIEKPGAAARSRRHGVDIQDVAVREGNRVRGNDTGESPAGTVRSGENAIGEGEGVVGAANHRDIGRVVARIQDGLLDLSTGIALGKNTF